jgi:hypothetical protein
MRRAGAVSVTGALFVALVCIALVSLLPNPVSAQQQPADPLANQPADIQDTPPGDETPDRIVIAFPQGQTCSVDANITATITVNDGGTPPTSATFTNGTDGATIAVEGNQIVVTADPANVPEGFETGTGAVDSSDGIVCRDDGGGGAQPPPNAECANPREVVSFGPTITDSEEQNVRIAGESFRVTYDVTILEPDEGATVIIDIDGQSGEGSFVQISETEQDSFISTASPGTFDITVSVDPPSTVRYTVTVEDCGAAGTGNGDLNCDDFDSQADAQAAFDAGTTDPNNLDADADGEACEDFPYGDIIDDGGDNDDDDLPETGGPPLALFAGSASWRRCCWRRAP